LSPIDVLHTTQEIERELGRLKKSINRIYSDRVIDIDILLYDDLHIDTPELTIPHPLMWQRDFVMIPLREIAPDENEEQ
jgi:2-amino-4-hydroxy-6-hydroxymethyldihydropteridine diphosphokinase